MAVVAAVNALVRVVKLFGSRKSAPARSKSTAKAASRMPSARPNRITPPPGAPEIQRLFETQTSKRVVEATGVVVQTLPDDDVDDDGTEKHQKFLVEIAGTKPTLTVKVAHNLKFERVPVSVGDRVRFRGEYEYTTLGGTVHWTHHDPRGIHESGWIELAGRRSGE